MRKISLSLVFSLVFLFLVNQPAEASLVVIDSSGQIIWKVLSAEEQRTPAIPKPSALEVKNVLNTKLAKNPKVSIFRNGDRIQLSVVSKDEEKTIDVTDFKAKLVEVEERPSIQNFTISLTEDNKFSIVQDGITVVTDFPITINAQKGEISVMTSSGYKFLAILPKEAVETLLRTKIISKINDNEELTLSEGEYGELVYEVTGVKVVDFLKVLTFDVPVKGMVSVASGAIYSVEQPVWLKVFGFLFT